MKQKGEKGKRWEAMRMKNNSPTTTSNNKRETRPRKAPQPSARRNNVDTTSCVNSFTQRETRYRFVSLFVNDTIVLQFLRVPRELAFNLSN